MEAEAAGGAGGKGSRLYFLDHLRAALVVLVVLHHVALVYGAGAPFYYVEPPAGDALAFHSLLVFLLVNQSWFMGALFLLSGYFTPGSFDRKGPASFLQDRLLRLGLPLLVFIFVLNPISSIGVYQMPAHLTGITTSLSWKAYPDLVGMGPMWFVALLLAFDFGYAGWRMLAGNRPTRSAQMFGGATYARLGVFVLALAAASYAMRMIVPLGRPVLGFPTLAYLPQYLSFFVLGVAASRRQWLQVFPASMGAVGFVAALVSGILLFPLAFSGHWFSLKLTPAVANMLGNGKWPSAVYALWDSLFAVGMCLAAIAFFRGFGGRQRGPGRFLAQHSYAVYICHIPTIVLLALALRGVELGALPKFALASVIMVPASFAVAWVVRKIPGVSRLV